MDYIPGYTTLRSVVSTGISYVSSFRPTNELFVANSTFGSVGSNVTSLPIDETQVPRWSEKKNYDQGDMIKQNGFLYTAIKKSSNINPVLSIQDGFITVNTGYWKMLRLSSKVIPFNPETDSKKTFFKKDIVNFDDYLYLCTASNCKADFGSNVWEPLSSSIINPPVVPEPAPVNYSDQALLYIYMPIYKLMNDFNIPDIQGETLWEKTQRIFWILYSYLWMIALFILAFLLSSYAANDLLHKEWPYRVLAYVYTFFFISTDTFMGYGIIGYYLIRSFFQKSLGMSPIAMYGILPIKEDAEYDDKNTLPTLYTYPAKLAKTIEEQKEIFNQLRLNSHGDIIEMLRRALHVAPKPTNLTREIQQDLESMSAANLAAAAAAKHDKKVANATKPEAKPGANVKANAKTNTASPANAPPPTVTPANAPPPTVTPANAPPPTVTPANAPPPIVTPAANTAPPPPTAAPS